MNDANASVIGATDGNIIATIITSQVTRKRPADSMAIPPMPIEPAWLMVINQATAAQTSKAATSATLAGLARGATRCCTVRV